MKKDNMNASRRSFLTTAIPAAAVSSIVAIETLGSSGSPSLSGGKSNAPGHALLPDVPVTTEANQVLINKTIPSHQNILGTDYVNVREYPITGTNNITSALNSALSYLSSTVLGGQILIPHGTWTSD